jgi:hypothetical protein
MSIVGTQLFRHTYFCFGKIMPIIGDLETVPVSFLN